MIGVYKITNTINNKSYIGQSTDINTRFAQHKKNYDNPNYDYNKVLYQAMRKHKIENFLFEVLEECEIEVLNEREKFYIDTYDTLGKGYNIRAGGDNLVGEDHPNCSLTEEDVIAIRKCYNNKDRYKEIREQYEDVIGDSGFSKVWKGESWKHISMEVYTKENKDFHRRNTGSQGESNHKAKLSDEDVFDIRTRKREGETRQEVYKDYKTLLTFGSFTNVWYGYNWKHIIV